MITESEKQEIIDKAVEKALLMLPEVVGNMMTQHVTLTKLNTEFYANFPEFKDHKEIVAAIVEMVNGKNPLMTYEDILKESVPKIRERIHNVKYLDMQNISRNPSRDFSNANGVI